ncbi:MAG TPA: THUMP domain-containing protein [Nitrososphaeraceae archaeon]
MNNIDFKLIISTFRGRELDAAEEFKQISAKFTNETPNFYDTGISGLIIIDRIKDPVKTVKVLKEVLENEPWYFRYILRVIPVESVCKTDLTEIISTACMLSCKIPIRSTFKIEIEKRFCKIRSQVIISEIAKEIKAKVSLSSPEWVVLVQILHKVTGISVLRPNEILRVIKVKRDFWIADIK